MMADETDQLRRSATKCDASPIAGEMCRGLDSHHLCMPSCRWAAGMLVA